MRCHITLVVGLIATSVVCCGCGGETLAVGNTPADASATPHGSRSEEANGDGVESTTDGQAVDEQMDANAPAAAVAESADANEEGADTGTEWDTGATDAGTNAASAKTLGERCTEVISEFCKQFPRCALPLALDQCINGYVLDCCMGSACMTLSTVGEDEVTSCKQAIDALDCSAIVNTSNPVTCLLIGPKDGGAE